MPANPLTSAGARLERQAFRRYLKREAAKNLTPPAAIMVDIIRDWVDARAKRYNAKPGGLGKR